MRDLRQKIRVRERLPIWGLRVLLGLILFTLSELVMWQNPPARSYIEWPILLVLYICLAAVFMDIVVRFQVNDVATLILASAIYGLLAAAIVNHSAFLFLENGPYSLIVRSLGLQTGAGLYGLMLYLIVMRGKPAEPLQVFGAMAIGVLWGVWVHWYPIQTHVNWGLVPIEQASLYVIIALVVIGFLVTFFVPRFRFIREKQMELLWWEAIVVGVPLFIALIVGMIQDLIPFYPLLAFIIIGAFLGWVLWYQRYGTDPSILAQIMFPAPNTITYIVLAVAFLTAGIIAYSFVNGADSPVGIAVFWVAFAFGTLGLPAALLMIFWRVFKRETSPAQLLDDEDL